MCDPLYAARRMYFISIRYTTSYGLTGRSPLRNTKFELLTYLKQSMPCSGRDNLPVQITPQKKELQIKWHKKPRGKNKNNTRRETPQKVCLVAKQTKQHAVGLNITEKMPILLTTLLSAQKSPSQYKTALIQTHCKPCTVTVLAPALHMLRLPYRDNHSVLAEKFSAQLRCSSHIVHSICEDKAGLGERGRSIKIPYEHRRQSQRGTFIKCPHASTHTSANYPHRGVKQLSFLEHR